MGDRRNIIVEFSDELSVALYTHWAGSDAPQTLANALSRGQGRWNDPTYLTRIIFSEMIKDEVLEETGYGIEPFKTGTTNYCEASPGYDIVVNVERQQVGWDETWYSFEHFVNMEHMA